MSSLASINFCINNKAQKHREICSKLPMGFLFWNLELGFKEDERNKNNNFIGHDILSMCGMFAMELNVIHSSLQ